MSLWYAESNNESSRELFEKRTIYRVNVANSLPDYRNLVDFNFGEKFLYGRVSRLFVPIQLEPLSLKTKNFKAAPSLSAVNFVVDAFEDLAAHFAKCASSGQIDPNNTFLSTLTPYAARPDPNALYSSYLETQMNEIRGAIRNKNVKIRNFDEFLVELDLLLEVSAPTYAFTKPGFIKSRFCPINASGLAVEIADLNAANDDEKINQFVTSKNWEFYVNACRSFGFMVDRAVPWRLVADIASSPMLDYAEEYAFSSTDQILILGYVPVHLKYFPNFKYHLLNLYNKVKLKSFFETTQCNGKTITRRVIPQNYSIAQLDKIYSEAYFLKLYFKIRLKEEESQFENFEKEMLIDDCMEVYENKGYGAALGVFERILNKPFDYRGSLSYIREYTTARRAETI
tara:strand:+ start:54 stop:1250 length:1197 start_codon:yes stop_codon:yes gene_type:complete